MQKSELLDLLKTKRKELQAIKDDIQKQKKGKDPADVQEAEEVIAEAEQLIDETQGIQCRNGKFADFVKFLKKLFNIAKKDGIAGVAAQAVVSVIGAFVNKYLNKNIHKELVNVSFGPARQRWGRLSINAGISFSFKVALNGEATSDIVVIRGAMGAFSDFLAEVSLDAGFTIPVIKKKVDCVLTGGIKGDIAATAAVAVSLRADGPDLKGALSKTTINTETNFEVYFIIPDTVVSLWNGAADLSFGYLSPINDPKISKNFTKLQLLTVMLPGYDVSFSMKNAAFSGKPNGSVSVSAGPDVQAFIDKVESYMPW